MMATGSPTSAVGSRALARLSMLMMTVALGACGGGGGGGDAPAPGPAPAPPPVTVAPALSLKADAASVSAGDAAVGLHAALVGGTDPVLWTLSGPGTLSAAAGADITYIPPDADSLDADATATVTVGAGSAPTKSVDIAVAAVDRAGHHWTMARASARTFVDVAYANGAFVALTGSGFSHSADGLSWTDVPAYPPAAAAAWGDAGWVAVGTSGNVFTSADGAAWTNLPNAIPAALGSVVFGNHTYLAYGNQAAAVSTDGVHWTIVNELLSQVAFGNGQFMALRQTPATFGSDVHPYVSTDGVHWQPATDLPGLYGLVFSDGQFVATTGSWYETTSDGSTWVGVPMPLGFGIGRMRQAGDALFELEGFDMGVQLAGGGWQRAGTGNFLSMPAAVAASADRYVGVSWDGWITTSVDALHWSTQVEGSYGQLNAIDFVDGEFVAASTLGQVLRSADGVDWSKAAMLSGTYTPLLYPEGMVHGGGTLVAVGSAGSMAGAGGASGMWLRSSDDGVTWARAATTPPAEGLFGLAYDGHRFVAVSASGGIYASPDGDAWGRLSTAPTASFYRGIAYGGGTYLVYGTGGLVGTSPDGVTWVPPDPAALAGPAATTTRVDAAMWDGTRFVVTGTWTFASFSPAGSFAAVSTDGRQWTVKTAPALANATALTRCGSEYVAVGNGMLASSVDGLNWNAHGSLPGATQLDAVACCNDRFVGVGYGSAIVTSTR